jgi:multiple sugar transport system substrate-binding protein
MHSDPAAKQAFQSLVHSFKAANPDIPVTVNVVDHESFKVQIRTWLPSNPPDVVTWFAGNRAAFFVNNGLIEPIDDLWLDIGHQFSPATREVVRFHNRTYLLPMTYYQWGIFYRKDLFKKAGIASEPATWDDLLSAIRQLNAAHIQPFAIGTKDGWPAIAWFEFLNLRLNGYEFHRRLMAGDESFLDPRLSKVTAAWRELIQLGAFSPSAPAFTWQEAAASLWQGRAAMCLIGNFLSASIPPELAAQVGFFRFPTIDATIADAEVAPVDVLFIPAKARHKAAAKRFLRFAASPENQVRYSEISHLLPTNVEAVLPNPSADELTGLKILREAKGLTQFFDRDSGPLVAKAGTDGFVEFMAYPEREPKIFAKLEEARLRAKASH